MEAETRKIFMLVVRLNFINNIESTYTLNCDSYDIKDKTLILFSKTAWPVEIIPLWNVFKVTIDKV